MTTPEQTAELDTAEATVITNLTAIRNSEINYSDGTAAHELIAVQRLGDYLIRLKAKLDAED